MMMMMMTTTTMTTVPKVTQAYLSVGYNILVSFCKSIGLKLGILHADYWQKIHIILNILSGFCRQFKISFYHILCCDFYFPPVTVNYLAVFS
jgi:hypothetical protein